MEKMKNKITIKTIPMKDYREFYVTLDKLDLAGDFFEETLAKLEKEDILLSKVVFFGNVAPMEKIITRIRSKVPCLVIGNSLPDENVSVCISGIKIMQGESQLVELDGEIIGRYFKLPDYEYLNVSGSYLKNHQADFRTEADGEYAKIAKVLARYDFSAKDIYRFWNYMVRVWENYPAFNEARNSYFKKNEITKLPAATGIEAVLGGGKKINLGFEAVKVKNEADFSWETFGLEVQREPAEYGKTVSGLKRGPKFSRAALVNLPGQKAKKIYISGISSADEAGESSLKDDLQKNVAYVMASFESLLKKRKFGLENLVSTHVYFKTKEIRCEFEKLYADKNWSFPYTPVFTNVCRESFLFEIEGIASDHGEDYFFA